MIGYYKMDLTLGHVKELGNHLQCFKNESDRWAIVSSLFQTFPEEGFDYTKDLELDASVIIWKEVWGFLGNVLTQNYVDLHMPQTIDEFKFYPHLKPQSVELFKA